MTTTLVIFGISGDLARRKLVPALFTLHCKGRLPNDLRVIGVSRSDFTDTMCRLHVWDGVRELADLAIREEEWEDFASRIFFARGDISNPASFDTLRSKLEELEAGDAAANRLFYLAIAPSLFETAIANLGAAGLAQERAQDRAQEQAQEPNGWRRVVIEKPFGRDGASARALDRTIHSVFSEDQVYRIDHYLGKETVQNLLVFRFANAIFEPIWNRTYVDHVQITVAEQVDVSDRGASYDESGVVRDMVQNHLLQLLTIVAMEPPNSMEADALRNEKVKVLQGVRRWSPQEVARNTVAAQYKGYRDERGVAPDSRTPTYIALRLFIDNWRWQGVPFYLRSGKTMAAKASEIAIQFRRPPYLLFNMSSDREQTANALALCLQPDEGMHLRFQVKVPDAGMTTRPNAMEFHYDSSFGAQAIPEAYERLLQDALNGDASLFMRADQVEQAWAIVQPVLEAGEAPDAPPMAEYERGSWGPEAADHLPDEMGHQWLHLCGAHGLHSGENGH